MCLYVEHTFSHYQRNLIYNTQFMQFCILQSYIVYLSTMNRIHWVHLHKACVYFVLLQYNFMCWACTIPMYVSFFLMFCAFILFHFVCVKNFICQFYKPFIYVLCFSSSFFAHSLNCCLQYYSVIIVNSATLYYCRGGRRRRRSRLLRRLLNIYDMYCFYVCMSDWVSVLCVCLHWNTLSLILLQIEAFICLHIVCYGILLRFMLSLYPSPIMCTIHLMGDENERKRVENKAKN